MGLVLVTGGSRGIGAATARRLVQRGDAVVVNYARDAAAAEALAGELRAADGRAWALPADVADEAQVRALYAAIDARAVPEAGPLTGLVNNAGIVAPTARVDETDAARLQRLFAVNVFGAFHCAREAIRRMSTRHGGGGGVIVNLSSGAARIGAPGQYVDYAATKGAIDTFTAGLAKEVAAEGVRVCAVRPGIIDTEIHAAGGGVERMRELARQVPAGRAGTADEVAAAIVWLLSAEAGYCAGAVVDVTGGR